MEKNNKDSITKYLPLRIPFDNRVDLIKKVLRAYSATWGPIEGFDSLSDRDIDLLTLTFFHDISKKDFVDNVVKSRVFPTRAAIMTEMSRLKDKGLIIQETWGKVLHPHIINLQKLVNEADAVVIEVTYMPGERTSS